jgi:hypothetical protein
MKHKILILVLALTSAINIGHASFPVQKKEIPAVTLSTAEQKAANVQTLQPAQQQTADDVYVSPAADGGKSQLVALLLVIFVGGIGIHRFYLGYTAIGIIQLITLGGCGIWALIDLIRIAMGDLKPKGGEYSEKL